MDEDEDGDIVHWELEGSEDEGGSGMAHHQDYPESVCSSITMSTVESGVRRSLPSNFFFGLNSRGRCNLSSARHRQQPGSSATEGLPGGVEERQEV
jgi:hypothetical protein